MSTTVKISELTSSVSITDSNLLVTALSGSTRKMTVGQLAQHITSSVVNLNLTNISGSDAKFTSISGTLNGLVTNVTTVASSTSVGSNNHIILINAASGAITLTLPDASTVTNREFKFKKIDSTANIITISGSSSQTIDGELDKEITTQYEAFIVVSNGSNWFVF